jgi:HEAT repeat protein
VRVQICVLLFAGSFAIAGCGKGESTDGLIENLTSEETNERVGAARQLQNHKGDAAKAVPALIESLKDMDASVRLSAAIGLGNFGAEAESALPELDKAKSDKDRRVRDAAKRAISRIAGEEVEEEQASPKS